jgi:hypothetical protein
MMRSAASRGDWRRARQCREEWAAAHRARLLAGGLRESLVAADDAAAIAPEEARFRELLARVLDAPPGISVEETAHEIATATAAPGGAGRLANAARLVREFEARLASRRSRHGVRLHVEAGLELSEHWLDAIHEHPGGTLLVEYGNGPEAELRLRQRLAASQRAGLTIYA